MNHTSEIEKAYQREKRNMLALSLVMDAIGMATYIVPGLTEFVDIAWAPLAGTISFLMFRGRTGLLGGAATFVEELLPVTDVVPSFSLTWVMKYHRREHQTMEAFAERYRRRKTLLAD